VNIKQTIFVNEYLKCFNASEAARRAGYNGKSNVIGAQLLANLSIREEIERRVSEITMTANEALIRLAEQARVDIGDFAQYWEGDKFNLQKAKEDGRSHLIKKLKPTQYGTELELHDKDFAIDRIIKMLGMVTDRQEITGVNGGPIQFTQVEIQLPQDDALED
jgi:phage terminase small subunit